jgi:epoxyqueuosine reductase
MKAKANNSEIVKKLAYEMGFSFCGISQAGFLEEEAPRLEKWLKNGQHGQMSYMERHFDKRLDPCLLVPGAQSVVSLLYNYATPAQTAENSARISRYAYGEDYHLVIKEMLFMLLDRLREKLGDIQGRVFVDSAPVLEKAWAAKSGLGWVGKHTNLITRQQGSWFFLAELIIDLPLDPDGPIADYCGRCTRCIDACPTEAITPYEVDGSKCISYYTIELKEGLDATTAKKFDRWAFGCDICQEVCPWNRFAVKHREKRFEPTQEWLDYTANDWLEITEETFIRLFGRSPLQRTGYQRFKENLRLIFSEENMQP